MSEEIRSKEGHVVGQGQHGNQEQQPFKPHSDYTRDGAEHWWDKPDREQCMAICVIDDPHTGESFWCEQCPNHPNNKQHNNKELK